MRGVGTTLGFRRRLHRWRAFGGYLQHSSASNAGSHQTPIVNELWKRREELGSASSRGVLREGEREIDFDGNVVVAKDASCSYTSVDYAFSTDGQLVEKYSNPWGHVRVGRMLEDLDALAGTIAFAHCSSPSDRLCESLHIVTASVDRVKYLHRADTRDDIRLSGRVGWVGNSSLEIDMQATSSWTKEPWLNATFTFVARDRATGKAATVNRLVCKTDEERGRFGASEKKVARRKQGGKDAKGASKEGECEEQTRAVDALMSEAALLRSMPALAPPQSILLEQTKLQNALITQPQQINTAGRIFGGFLMRRAFELSFAT